MKPILFILCLLWAMAITASAQTNFSMKLYAGSNASWGKSQYLSIDPQGHLRYDQGEVNKGIKDSLAFMLTTSQMAQLHDVINTIRFFSLDKTYNAQSLDGTRLSVEVSIAGKTHTVHWINIHTRESELLLDNLNLTLKSKGIVIHY